MLHSQEESSSRFGSSLVLAALAAAGLACACADDDGAAKTSDAVTPSSMSPTRTPSQTTTDGEATNGNPKPSPPPTSVNASGGSGGMESEVEGAGGSGGGAEPEPGAGAGGSSPEPADAGAVDSDDGDAGSEPHQFKIEFDYRFDSSGYFSAERRLLLEYAASLWANVIGDDFEEIPAETPVRLRNIQDLEGEPIVLVIEEPIDDLRLYVNCSSQLEESVGGFTQALATLPDLWGEDFKERLRERFAGPDHEPWAVAVTFNCNEPFFFDESPQNADDLGGDQADFLSTALHEIGHALGLGISITFDNLRSGDEFLGENAMELFGGPVPMVPGSGHVVEGTLVDGGRVLMDLSRERGTRDLPSPLDLAMLKDIGYEVVD